MTIARSRGWIRIKCLFHGAFQMLRKSASRIVASSHLVKTSLCLVSLCLASIFFATSPRRIDSGLPFFTYALSMDYVLGFDGGGTKTECVLMDPVGKILARNFSGPDRKSTRLNSSHLVISYAVFCLKKKKERSSHQTLR